MGLALANLLRNLRAGARLASFRRVRRLDFRIDLAQAVLLFAVSALIDVAGDYLRVAPPREFVVFGVGAELHSAALLVLGAVFVAIWVRQREAALAIVVLALAALPLVQMLHYVAAIGGARVDVADLGGVLEYLFLVWVMLLLVRCVAVALSPPPTYLWLRAILGGVVLSTPIWAGDLLYDSEPWWRIAGSGALPVARSGLDAGSEAVLAAQSYLLDDALANLADERSTETDLYFVAFAPDAGNDAYRGSVEAAQQAMDGRWGTRERSLVLVNSPRTLVTAPFATVTHLREALDEIGAIIDPEVDVVMLYLAAPVVRNGGLQAAQPPLSLVDLGPTGLKQLLDDAGIKWRIIVVSACRSGTFIEPLADDFTLVITDAAADRPTFGCAGRVPAGLFGDAFFTQGLARLNSFAAAFEVAQSAVASREAAAGYVPASAPQWSMGSEMAQKIKTLRGRLAGNATARLDARRRARPASA
ncbi:MAG: hypothetical protein IT522_04060 [Burkholderiales bacterium]|nr:hypothetical protein [Burkholderiales bacterium]